MKNLILALFCLLVCSFKMTGQQSSTLTTVQDNETLKTLYQEDQADRKTMKIDWKVVSKRDEEREAKVYELLEANKVQTANDYHNAAMIFQHGRDSVASGMAVKMMQKAVDLDPKTNKWLLAAAIDRDLMYRDLPQIYGTQYRKMGPDDPWFLHEIDSTKVTDAERIAYGVETLAQQREKVKKMNKKKLSDLWAEHKSIEKVLTVCREEEEKTPYDVSEGGINSFGYQLMGQNKMDEALAVFQFNTEKYPNGYNTFDSLGECLLKIGQKEEGLAAYQKSLDLNPKNNNAKEILEKAGKD